MRRNRGRRPEIGSPPRQSAPRATQVNPDGTRSADGEPRATSLAQSPPRKREDVLTIHLTLRGSHRGDRALLESTGSSPESFSALGVGLIPLARAVSGRLYWQPGG